MNNIYKIFLRVLLAVTVLLATGSQLYPSDGLIKADLSAIEMSRQNDDNILSLDSDNKDYIYPPEQRIYSGARADILIQKNDTHAVATSDWQISTNGGTSFSNIGVSGYMYDPGVMTNTGSSPVTYTYRLLSHSGQPSATATITVVPDQYPGRIIPSSQAVETGYAAQQLKNFGHSDNIQRQWQHKLDDGNWMDMGLTSENYSPGVMNTIGTHHYRIRNGLGKYSETATINVTPIRTGAITPISQYIPADGAPSVLRLDGENELLILQWQEKKDDGPWRYVSGAIRPTHTPVISAPQSGEVYHYRVIFNNDPEMVSKTATITITGYNHPTENTNSIAKYILQEEVGSTLQITTKTRMIPTFTYYDEIGRPQQIVEVAASPDKMDIIKHIEYDLVGRDDTKVFLPYVAITGDGSRRSWPTYENKNYYRPIYEDEIDRLFVQTDYEASILDRPVRRYNVGAVFADKAVTYDYEVNSANEVLNLSASSNGGFLATWHHFAGTLYKNTITDEDGKQTVTFTDGKEKIILTRVNAAGVVHDTYNVYDDVGRLRWVVSPEMSRSLNTLSSYAPTDAAVKEYCYMYVYDDRGRIIEKRLPGCGVPEYYVYDKAGRMVMSQDANLRTEGRWLYTAYDKLGRVTHTCLVSSNQSRSVQQNLFSSHTYDNPTPTELYNPFSFTIYSLLTETRYDSYPGTSSAAGSGQSGGNDGQPTSEGQIASFGVMSLLTGGGEDYLPGTDANAGNGEADFKPGFGGGDTGVGENNEPNPNGSGLWFDFLQVGGLTKTSDKVKGLMTYQKTAVIDGDFGTANQKFIESAYHYDKRGRLVQTVEKNILGGISRYTSEYDFAGNLLVAHESHSKSSVQSGPDDYIPLVEGSYFSITYTRGSNGQITTATPVYSDPENRLFTDAFTIKPEYHIKSVFQVKFNSTVTTSYYYIPLDCLEIVANTMMANWLKGPYATTTTFPGEGFPLTAIRAHSAGGGSTGSTVIDTKVTRYTYDHRNRLLSETTKVNSGREAAVNYHYDELGKLAGRTYGSGTGAVTESLSYNIQGWLTSQQSELFGMELKYYDPRTGVSPSWTGNITEWRWKHSDQAMANSYGFTYDSHGRLTGHDHRGASSLTATSWTNPANSFTESGITYDRNGNILSLVRFGQQGMINNLDYMYTGNKLITLNNRLSSPGGIAPAGGTYSANYSYDVNGNMTHDGRKNLNFSYNYLNLIQEVSGNVNVASYGWLADGTKVQVTDNSGNGYVYLGSLIYDKSGDEYVLESTGFGGGRIQKAATGYDVNYQITDHLGSVRVIFRDKTANGIVARNDYYAFGTKHQNSSLPNVSDDANRWLYNGKEKQTVGDISLLDYGARMYDTSIGRWFNIDPLAEIYTPWSPYAFSGNNPVRFVDNNGMDWYSYEEEYEDENGEKQKRTQYAYTEERLSRKEMEARGYTKWIGFNFEKNGTYYSLLGDKYAADSYEGRLYSMIDKVIVDDYWYYNTERRFDPDDRPFTGDFSTIDPLNAGRIKTFAHGYGGSYTIFNNLTNASYRQHGVNNAMLGRYAAGKGERYRQLTGANITGYGVYINQVDFIGANPRLDTHIVSLLFQTPEKRNEFINRINQLLMPNRAALY